MEIVEIKKIILSFITESFLSGRTEPLGEEEALLGNAIDSTGVLEFVNFLQERFGIVVEDEEVAPENFESVKTVAAFVARKMKLARV